MGSTTRPRILPVILLAVISLIIGIWGLHTLQQARALATQHGGMAATGISPKLAHLLQRAIIQLILVLAVVALLVAAGASYVARQFTRPLRVLADAVTRAADGDYVPIDLGKRNDEIGDLTQAIDIMTARSSDMASRLEEQTAQLHKRAVELADSHLRNERLTLQLEAVVHMAREISATLDPDQLIVEAVHLISGFFGHYHTGVYLLDKTGRWAVLRAATGEGGQRMLAHGHQLEVGTQGIVGSVVDSGQLYVAHNVGADVMYFDNPDLPETRSEVALPLVAHNQIIGVLDVQSVAEAAFDEEDTAMLTILADQIAIALENARMLKASQTALAQAQVAQQQYRTEIWNRFAAQYRVDVFEFRQDASPTELLLVPEEVWDEGVTAVTSGENGLAAALIAPITVRGTVIGALGLQEQAADSERVWSEDDIALVETVADQVGQAMETARLYHQARQRASREQIITEITSRIRSAPDIDSILRTAVQEIRRTLGVSHGAIRLGTEGHLSPPGVRDLSASNGGEGDGGND